MALNVVRVIIALALVVVVLHPSTPQGWRVVAGIALAVGVFILLARILTGPR